MFQETKLGKIKDNTKDYPIVDGPFGTQLHAEEYTDRGVPVVRVSNLSFDGRFLSDKLVFITEKKALTLSRSKLAKGDLVVAKTGATIGKAALFPYEYGIVASSCLKASFDSSQADQRFMLYLIMSSEGQRKIIDGASGSTRTTINILPFENITFQIPPLPFQQKIADVLITVDRAIAQTEALIAKHQRIKTGLMQDLLTRGIDEHGELRDPSTHRFKSTPLGMIPEEWDVKPLGTIAEINSGVTLGRRIDGDNTVELPYLRVANVQDGYLDLSEIKTVRIYKNEFSRFALEKGDVLMNEGGDFDKLGRGTVWEGQISPCLHQNHVFRVRTNRDELLPEFLAAVSSSPYGKKFFVLSSKQSTNLASINSTQLRGFPIPCPSTDEQETIMEVLNSHEENMQKYRNSLEKLNSTKQGLMQDLLSGRVSVQPLMEGQNSVNTDNQNPTKDEVENFLSETKKENLIVIQGKRQDIVIGVPHHAPLGVSELPCPEHRDADENTGFLGAEVARLLDCNCIIACNATKDPNKNKDTEYSRQILSWKPRLLVEIHGHGGKRANFDIEISGGAADRNKWSLDLEERLKKKMFAEPLLKDSTISGDFAKIYFKATGSHTITAGEYAALHIELPKKIREAHEIYLPFCKLLAEAVTELMGSFDNIANL